MSLTLMASRRPEDPKAAALRAADALHPNPQSVRDEAFTGAQQFFDPRDRVQVKYEMLRRHRVDGRAVSHVAEAFGISRQGYYVAELAFQQQGIPGLLHVPAGRGAITSAPRKSSTSPSAGRPGRSAGGKL